jgi:hypothetical protein
MYADGAPGNRHMPRQSASLHPSALHAWDADGLIFSGARPLEDEDAIRHALTAIGHDSAAPIPRGVAGTPAN